MIIKLCGRNEIKGINTWTVFIIRYSESLLNWTKKEQRNIDHKTRKLMTIHKEWHLRDDNASMRQEKNEKVEFLPLRIAWIQNFRESKNIQEKSQEELTVTEITSRQIGKI